MGLDWIMKSQRGIGVIPGSITETIATPNTIEGLYGSDITISGTNQSLLVWQGSILLAQVVLAEIVTWGLGANSITILTSDPTELQLKFISNTERDIALTILEDGMNL